MAAVGVVVVDHWTPDIVESPGVGSTWIRRKTLYQPTRRVERRPGRGDPLAPLHVAARGQDLRRRPAGTRRAGARRLALREPPRSRPRRRPSECWRRDAVEVDLAGRLDQHRVVEELGGVVTGVQRQAVVRVLAVGLRAEPEQRTWSRCVGVGDGSGRSSAPSSRSGSSSDVVAGEWWRVWCAAAGCWAPPSRSSRTAGCSVATAPTTAVHRCLRSRFLGLMGFTLSRVVGGPWDRRRHGRDVVAADAGGRARDRARAGRSRGRALGALPAGVRRGAGAGHGRPGPAPRRGHAGARPPRRPAPRPRPRPGDVAGPAPPAGARHAADRREPASRDPDPVDRAAASPGPRSVG